MPTVLPDDEPDLPAVTALLTFLVSLSNGDDTDAQNDSDAIAIEGRMSDMRVIDLGLLGTVGHVAKEAAKSELRLRMHREPSPRRRS